jgi:hypothetical protein
LGNGLLPIILSPHDKEFLFVRFRVAESGRHIFGHHHTDPLFPDSAFLCEGRFDGAEFP